DVVRIERTVGNDFALLHALTLEHVELAPLRNQLLMHLATIIRGNDQTYLALGFLAERHLAALFREDRRFFRLARFEQVGNTRQTTGDVTGLGRFLRNTCNNATHTDLGTTPEAGDGTRRQEVLGRGISARHAHRLALGIDHTDQRTHVLARLRTILRINHFNVGQAGQLVGLVVHRDVFFHIGELQLTFHLDDDRVGVRIPSGDDLAALCFLTFRYRDQGAVGHLVALTLTT